MKEFKVNIGTRTVTVLSNMTPSGVKKHLTGADLGKYTEEELNNSLYFIVHKSNSGKVYISRQKELFNG